jgi:hypothetical protein
MEEEIEEEEATHDDNDNSNSNNNNNTTPQQNTNHRLQQVVDYQPGDCLKKGTQIFILLLVQQKE